MSTTINRKPVYTIPAKTIINFDSGFAPKLLCDGPTFSTGTACVYRCSFCYVPSQMAKSPHLAMARALGATEDHFDMVIRRENPIEIIRKQLTTSTGAAKFPDENDRRVIYASPLVDVAANMELVRETVAACREILIWTRWTIRLLSKSNLLPKVAELLIDSLQDTFAAPWDVVRERMIFGVSTGTFDDQLAKAFEQDTALVSKRLQSLYWLQDNGFRTFGMICPSLPEADIDAWAEMAARMIRVEKCEHVWAEVINVRGASMERTADCLRAAGFGWHANELIRTSTDGRWEAWSRATFLAHATVIPSAKLRFLQYVNPGNIDWWKSWTKGGAVLLGKLAHEQLTAAKD